MSVIPAPASSFACRGFLGLISIASLTFVFLLPITLVAIATICDLRTREIPDWISAVLLGFGLIAVLFDWTRLSFAESLVGMVLGFLITAPLFYLGGIGGGDVKLVTALGSVLGPAGLLSVLFWVAIAGGVLALIAKLRGQNDFAYVPAIFFGVLITCYSRGIG
jgi:prepilin peptidase CpaA